MPAPPLGSSSVATLDVAAGPAHEGAPPALLQPFRRAAVRVVKPRVSEETWAKLREIDPQRITPRLRPSLGSLATRYESLPAGSRRHAARYQRHFNQQRGTNFTLLQIGIGDEGRDREDGSALRTWKHFFPKAQIVGVDPDDKSLVNEKRISTYQGSQVDADLLRLQLQAFAACDDSEIRAVVHREWTELYEAVARRSGADHEVLRAWFAQGMPLSVAAAIGDLTPGITTPSP